MELTHLPTVNAGLNVLATTFLAFGYVWIRRGDMRRHRACMLAACGMSAAFLVSYVIYHWNVGSVPYQGEGWLRTVYFSILISHIVLAIAIVPLVAVTLLRALRGSYRRHRRIARWALPIWMYVSVTGVVIYLMLYHG